MMGWKEMMDGYVLMAAWMAAVSIAYVVVMEILLLGEDENA
jgi:hypothetical protein